MKKITEILKNCKDKKEKHQEFYSARKINNNY